MPAPDGSLPIHVRVMCSEQLPLVPQGASEIDKLPYRRVIPDDLRTHEVVPDRAGGTPTNAPQSTPDVRLIRVRNPLMGQPEKNLKCTWSAREVGYGFVTSL